MARIDPVVPLEDLQPCLRCGVKDIKWWMADDGIRVIMRCNSCGRMVEVLPNEGCAFAWNMDGYQYKEQGEQIMLEKEITREQYERAVDEKEQAQIIIDMYAEQQKNIILGRVASSDVFQGDELVFAAASRCICGAGLAYPKHAPVNYHWNCSKVLMGTADMSQEHDNNLSFMMYNVRPETDKETTRPAIPQDKD